MGAGLLASLIIILSILIFLSAFFSAAETAYSSVSKSKIEIEAKNKKRGAILIKKHYKSFGWTLSTILICNNLVNISASALITFLFTKLLGVSGKATIIATFVITPIIVIFGEIVPKLFAKKNPYKYLIKVSFVMHFFNIILFPITYPLSKIAFNSKITHSEREIKSLIDIAKKEGVLDKHEATLASKALDLDSTSVNKVMVKRKDIIFIDHETTVQDALEIFMREGRSRLPIRKNNEFIGILILKNIFLKPKTDIISNYKTNTVVVSRHIIVSKALEEMRIHKTHMVLVSEKINSTKIVGLLTIEDIIEELVGEIYDEHDKDLKITEIAHFKWIAIGSAKMSELEKNINLSFENINTSENIKYWLQSRINRKIKKGLIYIYKDKIKFKVISNKNKEETIIEISKK